MREHPLSVFLGHAKLQGAFNTLFRTTPTKQVAQHCDNGQGSDENANDQADRSTPLDRFRWLDD